MSRKNKKNKGPSLLWTQHLGDPKEQEDFVKYLKSAHSILERLDEIIEDKLEARKVFGEEDVKVPSFPSVAADRNGYKRGLIEIQNLLKGVLPS